MTRLKSIKKPIAILAVLLCVFTLFSFTGVKTVKGAGATEEQITALYEEGADLVATTGVDPDGHFEKIYSTRYGVIDLAYSKMTVIYTFATTKYVLLELYTDEIISQLSYETEKRAFEIRDELYELLTVDENFATLSADELESFVNDFSEKSLALSEELLEIVFSDYENFNEYIQMASEQITSHYQGLVAFTDENTSVTEKVSPKVYIYSQRAEIKSAYEYYVSENQGEPVPNMEEGFAEFGDGFEYQPDKFNEYKKVIDNIVKEAKAKLNGIPKNSIELAYAAFNDWLYEASQPDLTTEQKDALRDEAEKIVKKGVSVYENASPEVKDYYASEYKTLKDFLEKSEAEVSEFRTDSYVVDAVRVTALYKDNKQPAKVIPHGLELRVYPSYNGSASRNVGKVIKECDEELSVSYLVFMQFYKNPGTAFTKPYELPTVDRETGKEVVYQVEIDLAQYYKTYLSKESYFKDQTQNINDAYTRITDQNYTAETSLCYSYVKGTTTKLDYELKEGGKIVFYTNTLSSFCFAGIDTSTWLSSPIFWAIAVLALILIIVLIKVIIKNAGYTIKFYTNGGSRVRRVKAAKNEYFTMPASPVKQNFVFAGWYTDKALTNRFIGVRMLRRKRINLYAKWATPVTKERLQQYYDALRKSMMGYQKVSFKPTLGLVEKEHLASIYCRDTNVEMYLAINPEKAKKLGFDVIAHTERKFAEVPSKFIISTEESFASALKLVKDLFTSKGLQLRDQAENEKLTENDNRENGFAYYVTNERVASTPADYFELLRLALKGYALEKDPGMFKAGEKFTFARIYVTDLEAQLYLPHPHGIKAARIRDARFEDTPNLVSIKSALDIPVAYEKIEAVMLSYGFTKCPENSNDLSDVDIPDGNGFSYAIKF